LPRSVTETLGATHGIRIDTLVCDMILRSREEGDICLSPEVEKALNTLRSFMFEKVYRNPIAKGEESKAKAMLTKLC
jgi:dGTPase